MDKIKTKAFILMIPMFIGMELCFCLIAIFNNIFRGKYLLEKLTFQKFVEPEIEEFTGVPQTKEGKQNEHTCN